MAYQNALARNHNQIEEWQKRIWMSLASSWIFGFASTEQVVILFLRAVSPCSGKLAESLVPVDAESYLLAMDFVIGASDTVPAPSCEAMRMAA